MTAPLTLLITGSGLDKFTAAQLSSDIDLTVASVGITAATFVVAPTLTAVPGEIKRLSTISGEAVDAHTVHLTARDSTADAYSVRGLGLYLADGTLFAVYGGADVLVQKSGLSVALFSIDLAFPQGLVGMIQFGDTSFVYPPATETVMGIAEIATQAEVNTGTDDTRIVTPLKLAARIAAAIAGFVSSTRQVLTAGLATGGGDLTANRTITVPKASGADVTAGTDDSKAVTPAALTLGLAPAFALCAAQARKILTAGLATGGGDLTADRTITVPKASGADATAGTDDSKALTPLGLWSFPAAYGASGRVQIPGTKLVVQWFPANHTANTSDTFAVNFATACIWAASDAGFVDTDQKDNPPYPTAKAKDSVTFFNAISANISGTILAVGY